MYYTYRNIEALVYGLYSIEVLQPTPSPHPCASDHPAGSPMSAIALSSGLHRFQQQWGLRIPGFRAVSSLRGLPPNTIQLEPLNHL